MVGMKSRWTRSPPTSVNVTFAQSTPFSCAAADSVVATLTWVAEVAGSRGDTVGERGHGGRGDTAVACHSHASGLL